jgi:Na+/proline symporter
VTLLTLLIAVMQLENVFNLVLLSWAAMASAFGPILIILSLGKMISQRDMILMMITGVSTMCIWRFSIFNQEFYAAGVGIICSLCLYLALHSLSIYKKRKHIE